MHSPPGSAIRSNSGNVAGEGKSLMHAYKHKLVPFKGIILTRAMLTRAMHHHTAPFLHFLNIFVVEHTPVLTICVFFVDSYTRTLDSYKKQKEEAARKNASPRNFNGMRPPPLLRDCTCGRWLVCVRVLCTR